MVTAEAKWRKEKVAYLAQNKPVTPLLFSFSSAELYSLVLPPQYPVCKHPQVLHVLIKWAIAPTNFLDWSPTWSVSSEDSGWLKPLNGQDLTGEF